MDGTEWLNDAVSEDLPSPYNAYAKAIGIENLYRLSELAGGKAIYIPTSKRLFAPCIKRQIAKEYWDTDTTATQEQLSEKYDISRPTANSYIKQMQRQKK